MNNALKRIRFKNQQSGFLEGSVNAYGNKTKMNVIISYNTVIGVQIGYTVYITNKKLSKTSRRHLRQILESLKVEEDNISYASIHYIKTLIDSILEKNNMEEIGYLDNYDDFITYTSFKNSVK